MAAPPQSSLIDRVYSGFSERQARRLFSTLIASPPDAMRPRLTRGVLFAYVIAGFVHLATIGLFVGGVALIVTTWFSWLLALIGALLISASWALAPRRGRQPPHILSRDQAPELYRLADEIAASIDTPPIDQIAVSADVNASYHRYGFRRTSVLTLGVPMWLALDAPQRVALVGHEMGHQANGDAARGYWVGQALNVIAEWYAFLRQPYNPDGAMGEAIAQFMMYVLSLPVYWLGSILLHLFWTESQRAEYLADHLGSQVAGSEAYRSLNDRMMELNAREEALIHATLATPARNPDYAAIFGRYVSGVQEVSADEVREHIEKHGGDRHAIDSTHPPTMFRNQMVEAFPSDAAVTLSDEDSNRTAEEVSALNHELGLSLVRRWSNLFD